MEAIEVRVFTTRIDQGNPAAVIMNFSDSEDEMQALATILNYPVTVFVQLSSKSEQVDVSLRYFTPQMEIPACGHGTLGAAHYLLSDFHTKQLTVKTGKGECLTVERSDNSLLLLKLQDFRLLNIDFNLQEICSLLGITDKSFIDIDYPCCVASIGSPKLLFPVKDIQVLFNLELQFSKITEWSKQNKVNGIYVYTKETLELNSNFHARSFNPMTGANEDAATGVAAAALAAAVANFKQSQHDFIIEQGDIINRPSRLYISTKPLITLGGFAVTVGSIFT
ncbi:hypothetical protein VF14_23995 [Nostoc linckia z18]|uniref:PhzF family phenazine biosynthesis protein n=2 Tax=Nostoc linckia TaxID=92942 RepID=A0A9Q5Z9E1_NOSLI|nr:PhzF family phenazine biosynthesis protein [Nostoc linckia]PHK39979.1 hypothetical protein VF12_12265 [Nostoc linckia z15]PHK43999.1 hypothetical protein VF13_24110 [Nostoc linckia z16]PHJ56855.1 hypothetical protein VF02_31710 [Nostoc linckia z1]PHJ58745.1 hypothetical protein VF05_33300 [Nostoc linckia z3]PHJ62553.1 hypothetical protein VF03_31200 [Nostoc linckia z2]